MRLVAIDIQGTTGVLGGNAATASLAGSSFGIELGRANFAAPGVKSTLGSAGKAIARGLPVLGWAITAVSVGKDALDAYREYQKCTKAH